jgi:hypothetical protein
MSETLAYILVFGGIALIAMTLIAFALFEVSGEHRQNVDRWSHRHPRV